MKVALITDQHLDGRKGSLAFWNYFQKFKEGFGGGMPSEAPNEISYPNIF